MYLIFANVYINNLGMKLFLLWKNVEIEEKQTTIMQMGKLIKAKFLL